jgi:hypothetical protein
MWDGPYNPILWDRTQIKNNPRSVITKSLWLFLFFQVIKLNKNMIEWEPLIKYLNYTNFYGIFKKKFKENVI